MRAIRISENGGPEVLSLVDMPDPTPGDGQIVVDVAAAGVNFVDTYQRIGLYPIAVPYTAGLEGAGVVTAVGTDVSEVSVGDRVAWCGGQGSYAEQLRPGCRRMWCPSPRGSRWTPLPPPCCRA